MRGNALEVDTVLQCGLSIPSLDPEVEEQNIAITSVTWRKHV